MQRVQARGGGRLEGETVAFISTMHDGGGISYIIRKAVCLVLGADAMASGAERRRGRPA